MNLLLQAQGGGNMTFLVMMVAIFVIMWFFMIRPQQKKQKEISQKDKVLMAYEIVCNYVKSRYKEYYEAAFDEKNKIKLDLNAPNIGEHIWAVMNILFYCEKYNKDNQYLCSIETEGVPYIRPEFPIICLI